MENQDEVPIISIRETDSELSDDETTLMIIEDTPKVKKKPKLLINDEDKAIIEGIEETLENTLDEKAAKTKFSNINVKNMLKEVVTNLDVLAMVRQAENPEEKLTLAYEPKLTRAKAKELFPPQALATWPTPIKKPSKTQVLVNSELAEDSSGDEYIPGDDESEDDRDSSVLSEPYTPQSTDCGTQTTWTEDGVFKLPPDRLGKLSSEAANIGLRTRSKLCLSDTPLEVIEEAFVPPDITPDMYDFDCDDDDWNNFLKEFTRPLDEVTKGHEDEDHDPEYNVLADEDLTKVDKEELRADKGVKVSKKELNELMTELSEFATFFSSHIKQTESTSNIQIGKQMEFRPEKSVSNNQELVVDTTAGQNLNIATVEYKDKPILEQPNLNVVITEYKEKPILDNQINLLAQQMRQHVQLLVQSFLLSYKNPEYHEYSANMKRYLYALKNESNENPGSACNAINLDEALSIVQKWETMMDSSNEIGKDCRDHMIRVLNEVRLSRGSGIFYVPTFPKYLMSLVAESPCFLYPSLLPRIPFKPIALFTKAAVTSSESQLISMGLEQFIPFLKLDKHHLTAKQEIRLMNVSYYIQKYMVPNKTPRQIYKHIIHSRSSRDNNPIKYYFENDQCIPTFHYVVSLDQFQVLPPCQRSIDQLPEQWREYLYPKARITQQVQALISAPLYVNPSVNVSSTPDYSKSLSRKRKLVRPKQDKSFSNSFQRQKQNTCHTSLYSESDYEDSGFATSRMFGCSTPLYTSFQRPQSKGVVVEDKFLKVKFNSSIFSKTSDLIMLPSMPTLNTPKRCSPQPEIEYNFTVADIKEEVSISESVEQVDESKLMQDTINEISVPTVTSSTTKTANKRKPASGEKKRAKLRRDFDANLRMLTPQDEDTIAEKNNSFTQAFYDKLQEQLDIHDFHRFIETLNDFDEHRSTYVELYRKVDEILGTKYQNLMEEFLAFFTSFQAKNLGKLVPLLMMKNMSLFLRKLEMFFKDQPSQVRKIYRCITDLTNSRELTMPQIKNSVLPLLKGNSLLLDWFLQIFPSEKPPLRSLKDWESIEISKDVQEGQYETIILPETEDPYGGSSCICSCHNVDDVIYSTRSQHCTPCGTKFLQGRIYIQTGKGLRLAKLSFDDNNVNHQSRLSPSAKPKAPAKQISPGKDSQDETRLSSDEEPEKKHRKVKTPKKRKPKKKIVEDTKNTVEDMKPQPAMEEVKEETVGKKDNSDLTTENSDSSLNEVKHAVEENIEWDCNTSLESMELKLSPEHPSAESESEFCEETSQDNNTDSENSDGESETPSSPSASQSTSADPGWTRDEDKIILQTFQQERNREHAFQRIADVMPNRTMNQIKQRFDMLINLLLQMSKDSS